MRLSGIDEIAVNLVGDHGEVAPDCDLGDRLELGATVDMSAWIMRRAQKKNARLVVDQCFERFKIDVDAVAVIAHLMRNQPASRIDNELAERRVAGNLQHHAVAGVAEGENGRERPLHQIGDRLHQGRVHLPAEARLHACGEGARCGELGTVAVAFGVNVVLRLRRGGRPPAGWPVRAKSPCPRPRPE